MKVGYMHMKFGLVVTYLYLCGDLFHAHLLVCVCGCVYLFLNSDNDMVGSNWVPEKSTCHPPLTETGPIEVKAVFSCFLDLYKDRQAPPSGTGIKSFALRIRCSLFCFPGCIQMQMFS